MLRELARIIDPDFGMDIVACGFVKDLQTDGASGRQVSTSPGLHVIFPAVLMRWALRVLRALPGPSPRLAGFEEHQFSCLAPWVCLKLATHALNMCAFATAWHSQRELQPLMSLSWVCV